LLSAYAGQGADLKPWLKGAAINREAAIYDEIVSYRTFPEELFVTSEKS
jgi:hypothetical protein